MLHQRDKDIAAGYELARVTQDDRYVRVQVERALTASAGKRLAPSKQLTATMNGVPCRSK